MKLHKVTFILLVIGGLNWLLVGLIGGWDLANILGGTIAKIVYIVVGLSAIYEIVTHKKNCKACDMKAGAGSMGGGNMMGGQKM